MSARPGKSIKESAHVTWTCPLTPRDGPGLLCSALQLVPGSLCSLDVVRSCNDRVTLVKTDSERGG